MTELTNTIKLPAGGGFRLGPIAQIAVRVHDLERAAAFYEQVLGLKLLLRSQDMAFFDAGGVRLMLSRPEQAEFDHPSSILYFAVADVRAAYQALVERGVRFMGPPHQVARLSTGELWMAFFRDSEQNLLALSAEQPASE
ncbi:MAG: VOC family protein [Terriglobales bacterium]